MPELEDVRIGETIAVEWGNAIRDRTIQRYANAAERDELHPNPTEGDLSYLEDTNSIEVYDGFEWVAGIPNGAVTSAKLANASVSQPKLAAEAVTFSKIADGAVITSKLADGAVTAVKIADQAVTTRTIRDGHVSTSKIADQAVTQPKIAPEAVTSTRLAPEAVTFSRIADGAVITAKIADQAVTTGKIADQAVTQPKIAPEAVTSTRLAPEAVTFSRIAGNAISSGFVRMAGTSGSPSLSTSDAALLSTSINIPSVWNTWSVVVTATGRYSISGSVERVRLYLRVPGSAGDSPFFDYDFTPDGNSMPCALTLHRSERTVTGSQTFELRGSKTGPGTVILVATTMSVIVLRES